MAGHLEIDAEGLMADGRLLAEVGDPASTPIECHPPALDPVTVSMADMLTAYDESMCQRLAEAQEIRAHGGSIVTASGVMFEAADEQGALEISRVEIVGESRSSTAEPPSINQLPQPQTRVTTAKIPPVAEQSLDAETFSAFIHDGSQGGSLHSMETRWTGIGSLTEDLGEYMSKISELIDEHWDGASAIASRNVHEHGHWLRAFSVWIQTLTESAYDCFSAYAIVRQETPTPEELIRARLVMRLSNFSPIAYLIARRKYLELVVQTLLAGADYRERVDGVRSHLDGTVPGPAELIAKRAEIPNELTKGPGTWVSQVRREGDAWRNYELQTTGFPAGMEYEITAPNASTVDFDGYDAENNILIESKGDYEWAIGPDGNFKPGFGPAQSIPKELERQYDIASSRGIPVVWKVAGPKSAAAIERMVSDRGFDDMIDVVVVPAE